LITSDNIGKIDWMIIDRILVKLTNLPAILGNVKSILRGKVTSNNIKEINRFILDSIEY
jgi:hypothetical protein